MRREWMLHFASADGLTGTAWLKTNPLQVFKRPIGAGNPLAMGYLDECRDRSYQLVKIDNEHGNAYYEEIVEGRNVAEMSAEIADLRDEIAGTIKVRDQAFEKIAEMTAEITRLRAELERVREALAPFADTGKHYNPATPSDQNPSPSIWCSDLTVGDLRRAAQVMKEIEQ